jgi:transcriptional regulator GlxA family with amidase domain
MQSRKRKQNMDHQFRPLSEQKNKYPPLVQAAVSLIEAQYSYLYGIDELADLLEVTKHHLIRVFTAGTGISPGKYLTDVRIFHAKLMLRSGENAPIEIIAGACGYSCGNYFSKVFKKHTGFTPTDYLKTAQRDIASPEEDVMEKFYL